MKRCVILILVVTLGFCAAALASAAQKKGKDAGQVIIAEWGGSLGEALKKAYYEPFEKETGIKVIQAEGPDPAKTKAMVDSGNVEWDIVEHSMMEILNIGMKGYLEAIDYGKFDKETLKNIPEQYKHKFGIGGFVWSNVLAYSTEAFPGENHPHGWADFWNVDKFPGPRSLESGSSGDPPPFEYALFADGVAADKIYPIDIDRAFKSLKKIEPYIGKWWTSGAQPGQMLVDGEVVATNAFSGRIIKLKMEGAPVDIDYYQGLASVDFWVVPRGAPNKENAMKLLAFMSKADRQAEFAKLIPYGPVNQKAYDYIDKTYGKLLPSHPDNVKLQIFLNHEYWSQNREKGAELWTKWAIEK
jgi:putative spermidine/putrescine transport system substrate-binding protein